MCAAYKPIYKPKVGRAPWLSGPVGGEKTSPVISFSRKSWEKAETSKQHSAAGVRHSSSGEWDSRIAISLILLIIVINVALTMALSSDDTLLREDNKTVATASDQKVSAAEDGFLSGRDSREELLSIISRY